MRTGGKGGEGEGEAEEGRLFIKGLLHVAGKQGYVTAFEGRSQCLDDGLYAIWSNRGLCFVHISWGYLRLWSHPIHSSLFYHSSFFFRFFFSLFLFLFLFLFFFFILLF